MPPKQCPECRRLLRSAFIEASDASGTPCPRCAGSLTTSSFRAGAAEVPVPAGGAGDEVSIRPPDLEPEAVRDRSLDVLAGWDVGVDDAEVASWRQDRRPVPVDTLAVAGTGAAGVLLGLLLVPQHRVRSASLGALAGIVVAAAVRRVWVLRP